MSGYVYVIAAEYSGPCKIGVARDVESRRRSLQTGSPYVLEAHYAHECANYDEARALERACHARLSDSRLEGEWYEIPVSKAIDALQAAVHAGIEPMPKKRPPRDNNRKNWQPWHPEIPQRLRGKPKRQMTPAERQEYWACFELDEPPAGFDDWFIIGSAKAGVLGAVPICGFSDED